MNLNSPQNKVFGSNDLRRLLFTYVLPEKCLSCKKILKDPKITKPKNYKDYRNYDWRQTKNKYMNDVCNWCYHYVYEYP